MDTFTAIAIFVSILGVFLILAIVWLVHKYNAKRRTEAIAVAAEPPMRKLIIHRGRVVPASKLATPSIRSGWTSLRHREWLLSSPSIRRPEDSAAYHSRTGAVSRHNFKDIETGNYHGNLGVSDMQTVLESDILPPSHITNQHYLHTEEFQSKKSTAISPQNQFWNKQYPKSATIEERTKAARSFLKGSSTESLSNSPNFPRPPYLSPLQSRFHVRHVHQPQSTLYQPQSPLYQPQSPLHRTTDADSLLGKEIKI